MSNYSEEIWVLITRVLSGEASLEERDDLRKWLNEDIKHREFYRNIESSWAKDPDDFVEDFFFDHESGLNKLRDKLSQESSIPVKSRMPRKHFRAKYAWTIAATILLISLLVFMNQYIWEQSVDANTYVTSEMEQRIMTLSDGSVVRLNRNSKIEIEKFRDASIRRVRLEGEAFFDVAKDVDRPFVINTDEAVVRVLGTSFNVKEDDDVMVAVEEGIVSLRRRNRQENSAAKLIAGQLGLLSQNDSDVKIEETNIENYMSWMNGYLRFGSMPFDQVIKQLERIYGMKHELEDPSIGSLQLTVFTELTRKKEVLETIALALDLTYYEQEGVIYWKQKRAVTSEE